MTLKTSGMTAEKLSRLKPPVPKMPKSGLLKYKDEPYSKSLEPSTYAAFSMDSRPLKRITGNLGQSKPQTIFEVLQNICEKNDLRFGQAIASIFGSDNCLFYKTNEELIEIINEKKIKFNIK